MTRNQATFIALGSKEAEILEVLKNLIDFECGHKCHHRVGHDVDCAKCGHTTDKDGNAVCSKVSLAGLEEAAVRIAELPDW